MNKLKESRCNFCGQLYKTKDIHACPRKIAAMREELKKNLISRRQNDRYVN